MDRRSFLKRSSVTALLAVSEWSGLTKAFAQSESNNSKGKAMTNSEKRNNMEHRRLGGMDVSAMRAGMYGQWWATTVASMRRRT